MKPLSVITGLSAVLAVAFVQPTQAAEMVVWDQEIASAVHQDLAARDHCRYSSSALSRSDCDGNELDISMQPIPSHRLTMLDRIALFVYRHKDLKLNQEVRPGTKLKFEANLSNVYKEEATVRLSLRIRF